MLTHETLHRATRHASRILAPLGMLALAVMPAPIRAQGSAAQPITLRFSASVDSVPFACGRAYSGVGSTHASITVSDFRFYVHDVRLLDAAGAETPVQLQSDSLWQSNGVALLDFEDGSGSCTNGNADVRQVVLGTAPAGRYTGVRFTVGVPFDLNHRDLTQQPSPLSLTRMFWAWNSGYKFMRVDMKAGPTQAWVIHLGSTECLPTGSATTVPTRCAWENRPVITLGDFDVAHDVVNLDLGAVLRHADVTVNQPKTAMGCMSGQTDNDCAPVFESLGLAFGTHKGATQTAFRVVKGSASLGAAPAPR